MKLKINKIIKIIIKMPTQIVVLAVDRSGSMSGKETDTVGGINACMSELKKSKGEDDTIKVSLTLFDHEQIQHWNQVNLDDVPEFTQNEFIPRGQTALLDTMGDSLNYYKQMKLENPEAFDTCIIYVATDGLENCSSKYTQTTIKSLIEEVERDHNITVMYLGANQDAIFEAERLGIAGDRAINYDESPETVSAVYRALGSAATRNRSGMNTGFLNVERQASQSRSTNHQSLNPPPITRNMAASLSSSRQNNVMRQVNWSSPQQPVRQSSQIPSLPLPHTPPQLPPLPLPLPPSNLPSPPIQEWKQHLFLDAAKDNNWNIVKGFLEETAELVNVVAGAANRWTALHQAAEKNNEEMVSYLLSKGANQTILNRDGHTASQLTSNANIHQLLE